MRSLLAQYRSSCLCLLLACALAAVQAFEPGKLYTYQSESRVVLSELQPQLQQQLQQQQQLDDKHTAQLTLRVNLNLSRLQFINGISALRLHFLAASVSNKLTQTAEATGAGATAGLLDLRPPRTEFLLVALDSSSPDWIGSVIAPDAEDPFWLNLARGVASLLRHRTPGAAVGDSREADTMGECGFAFAWLDTERRRLEKRATACENAEMTGERNSANPILAVRRAAGSVITVLEFSADQPALPDSVLATETHELLPDFPSGFGLRVSAKSHLRLLTQAEARAESSETLSAYLQSAAGGAGTTQEVALPTALEVERSDSTGSLAQFLTRLPAYLRDANPSMHALAIVQGLPLARGAKDPKELRRQLELEENQPLLPDILELYAACGTKQCIGALFGSVVKRLADLSDALLERLLLALAQSSRAGRPLLDRTRDLLQRLEVAGRTAAARAALHTLATLGRKLSAAAAEAGAATPESDVPGILLERLAACETAGTEVEAEADDCQLSVLSAMTNCPSGSYRRHLMRGLLANATSGSQVAVARLRALRASGPLDPAERRHLAGLLRQGNVPLSDPIRFAIAASIGGPAACAEAGIDCRSLRRGADLWLPLRRRHRQPAAGHEEVLAGLTSSAFHRGHLFSTGGGGAVDFELDMLGNRLGGIRLSDFRLAFAHAPPPSGQSPPPALVDVLGVRLYADAIDSLLDSSNSGGSGGGPGDLTEQATAGMQLGVLGEWLRPLRFFTGTSGLMSAVWNAPEAPVGVLRGGFLLHDFATRLHLHNGLVVQATLASSLALNVSGSLSVSIWNRNAVSRVFNSIGSAMHAQAGIRTGRFSVDFVSQAQAELLNSFATFVSFSEAPVSTCLVMSNSPVAVTRSCHVTDSLGPRYDQHSHDHYVPGRSFSLGQRNDRLCTELATDPDDE